VGELNVAGGEKGSKTPPALPPVCDASDPAVADDDADGGDVATSPGCVLNGSKPTMPAGPGGAADELSPPWGFVSKAEVVLAWARGALGGAALVVPKGSKAGAAAAEPAGTDGDDAKGSNWAEDAGGGAGASGAADDARGKGLNEVAMGTAGAEGWVNGVGWPKTSRRPWAWGGAATVASPAGTTGVACCLGAKGSNAAVVDVDDSSSKGEKDVMSRRGTQAGGDSAE